VQAPDWYQPPADADVRQSADGFMVLSFAPDGTLYATGQGGGFAAPVRTADPAAINTAPASSAPSGRLPLSSPPTDPAALKEREIAPQ
jgi:hypothetical protein